MTEKGGETPIDIIINIFDILFLDLKSFCIEPSRVVIMSVGPLLPFEDFTRVLLSPG